MEWSDVVAVMEWPGRVVAGVAGLALHPCAEHDPESSVSAVSASCGAPRLRLRGHADSNVTPKYKKYKEIERIRMNTSDSYDSIHLIIRLNTT